MTDGRYFYNKAQIDNRRTKTLHFQQIVSLARHERSSFTGTIELQLSRIHNSNYVPQLFPAYLFCDQFILKINLTILSLFEFIMFMIKTSDSLVCTQ